ncbi:MAG: DUF1460 domain-containing protein [Parabacteroides sp.]|nr:DUF1460 domain-containing protein [Parabacteroides sp.]
MMKLKYLILLLSLLSFPAGNAQSVEDKAVYDRYCQTMESKKALPTGDLMVETARFFLGTPYVAGTLEKEPEGLVVNLQGLDCMTLVENTSALVRSLKEQQHPSFDLYMSALKGMRYRNPDKATLEYTDRLHYTSDWIYENERRGYLKDVTKDIGGKPLELDIFFMSTHPDSYKQLKGHPERVAIMAAKEREISARPYYYIPQDEINAHAGEIRNGDIVCFVTTVKGLDISHVGIICREGEKLTFIHASTTKKQVIVNEEPLQEYVQGIKRISGIMIVRPQF